MTFFPIPIQSKEICLLFDDSYSQSCIPEILSCIAKQSEPSDEHNSGSRPEINVASDQMLNDPVFSKRHIDIY